jgi:pSer/pThr/pTyr-binding forkhead associated (FHA) protein
MPLFPAQITVVCPGSESLVYPLHGQKITVGRSPESGLVLTDESVSTHHAEIVPVDDAYMLRDLQSSNGTAVNGEAITAARLKVGDRITFGAVECVFQEQHGAEAPPLSTDPVSPATEEEAAPPASSFGSKLASLARAALNETKRNARLIALKAKIEKFKRIDLPMAHYALGKRCHELGLHGDQFTSQREAIVDLEQRIKAKRDGVACANQETPSEKFKRIASDTKSAAEAEGLALRLKRLLVEFGKHIAGLDTLPAELNAETATINAIHQSIAAISAEYAALNDSNADALAFGDLSHSLTAEAGAKAKIGIRQVVAWIRSHPTPALCVAVTCLLIVFSAVFVFTRGKGVSDPTANRATNSLTTVSQRLIEHVRNGQFEKSVNESGSGWSKPGLALSIKGNLNAPDHIMVAFISDEVDLSQSAMESKSNKERVLKQLTEFSMLIAAANQDAGQWIANVCLRNPKEYYEEVFASARYRYAFQVIDGFSRLGVIIDPTDEPSITTIDDEPAASTLSDSIVAPRSPPAASHDKKLVHNVDMQRMHALFTEVGATVTKGVRAPNGRLALKAELGGWSAFFIGLPYQLQSIHEKTFVFNRADDVLAIGSFVGVANIVCEGSTEWINAELQVANRKMASGANDYVNEKEFSGKHVLLSIRRDAKELRQRPGASLVLELIILGELK